MTTKNDWLRPRMLMCAALSALAAHFTPARASDSTTQTPSASAKAESSASTQFIQAGERLVLLGVTADNHAIYQDGTNVVATALAPGAQAQVIGTSPAGVVSFVYTVGNVAFVWTNPDRSAPGFGVSPLTVWSQASGANKASDHSPIGTFTTSASRDGRHVMYTTRGAADGSVGDIEFANTDMSERRTLLSGIPMSFPNGPCRPWGSFVGLGTKSHPVALFCEGGALTATLASWSVRGEDRFNLVSGVLTQPFFTASADGTRFFTTLADTRTPVVVNVRGELRRLEEGVLSRLGFFRSRDEVFYTAFTDITQPGEIHRTSIRAGKPSSVADGLFTILTAQSGSDLIITPLSSPDGRRLAYASGFDPNTGLSDVRVADLANTGATVVEAMQNTYASGPLFSADSSHVLFARVEDVNTFNAQLIAVGPSGTLALGDPSLWTHDRLDGARVAFNDNPKFNSRDFFKSTADLKWVDLSQPTQTLTTIATQAYLTFLPARSGKDLVYTTGRGSRGPGLYVAKRRE